MNIDFNTPLLDNKIIDSLGILECVTFIQKEFKIDIYDEELVPENFYSIHNLSEFIEKKVKQNAYQDEKSES
jgi:acyl carrier protein